MAQTGATRQCRALSKHGLRLLRRSTHRSASTSHAKPEIYDVVCLGGGPAGLSLLSALQSSPSTRHLKIALVESQGPTQLHGEYNGYSNRCSSLTPASIQFLTDIGGWSRVEKDRIQPYHAIKVWDGVSGSSIDFDPIDAANNALSSVIPGRKHTASYTNGMASMIENSNLTNALYQHVRGGDHVEILSNTRVEQIHLGEEDSEIDLRSWPVLSLSGTQRRFAARLLVGADGANSPVRSFSEITSRGWDYDRHGVVATLRMSDVSTGPRTAYQRFLPTGPIALLPLPGDYASLVWSTTPDRAAMLKSLGTSDFVAMVNAAFRLLPVDIDYMHKMHSGQSEELAWRCSSTMTKSGQTPADIESVQEGSVASFPLRMRHTDTYVGERVALIGDAAHSIHPLAGQGLNQGLGDAQGLAKQIQHAVSVGRDIGSSFVLDEYNATQWARNNAMLGTVDKLHKLYSASSGPVVWARSLGLDAVNNMGWLKGFFMRQAAGIK